MELLKLNYNEIDITLKRMILKKRIELQEGATVMKSTVVNTSKEMMAYSDFPPPIEYPNFMHNSLVMNYIRDYAAKFDLIKDIRFDTNVEKVLILFKCFSLS